MRILSRYFLASYLGLFAAILATSILAVAVIEVLLNFEEVSERFDGMSGVAHYLALRVPSYYFRDLVPVASFAAALFAVGLAARAAEITAIEAGGLSPPRTLAPLLLASAALSVATLLLNETVVLEASRAWSRLESPGEEIAFRRGSFWYHRDNVVYNVREADGADETLHGVSVYELSPTGRLLRSTRADVVRVTDGGRWRFVDATSRTFDPDDPTRAPRVDHVAERTLEVTDPSDLALLEARVQSLSLADLRAYVAAGAREGRGVARYESLLHRRLSEPVTVFAFSLLALPLGLWVDRTRSLALAALAGIALLGTYFALRTTAAMLAAEGLAPPALCFWALVAAAAGLGAAGCARRLP